MSMVALFKFLLCSLLEAEKSMGMEESCEEVDALKMIGMRLHAYLNISGFILYIWWVPGFSC